MKPVLPVGDMALKRETKRGNINPATKAVFIILLIILILLLLVNIGVMLFLRQDSIAESVKWQIIRFLEDNTNRHIEIGSVAPDFWQRLVIEDLTIGPSNLPNIDEELKEKGMPFVKVERITVDYDLVKLLTCKGDFSKVLNKVILYRPEINIEYDENRVIWNFSDLIQINPDAPAMQLPTGIPLYLKQGIVVFKGMPYMEHEQKYLGRKINAKAEIVTGSKVAVEIFGEFATPLTGWQAAKWPNEWLPEDKKHSDFYPINGKMEININNFAWSGNFTTKGVNPADYNYWIAPHLGFNLTDGVVDGVINLTYKDGYLEYNGDAYLKGVNLDYYLSPIPITNVSGHVKYSEQGLDNWEITTNIGETILKSQGYTAGGWFDPRFHAEVDIEEGDFNIVEGYLKSALYDRYLSVFNGKVSPQSKAYEKMLATDLSWIEQLTTEGIFTGKFVLSGYFSQFSIYGAVNVIDGLIEHPDFPEPLTKVNGLIGYKDGNVSINSFAGETVGGLFNISGSIEDVLAVPYLNLHVNLDDLSLQSIVESYTDWDVTGSLDFSADIGGFYNQPFALYGIEISPGNVLDYNHQGVNLSGRLANGVAEIENLFGKAYGAEIRAKGTLPLPAIWQTVLYPNEKMHNESLFELNIKGVEIQEVLASLPGTFADKGLNLESIEGIADLSFLAKIPNWSLTEADIAGTLDLPKISYEDIKVTDIKGGFYIRDNELGVEKIQAQIDTASLFISGTIPFEVDQNLNLELTINAFEPQSFAAISPQLKDLQGRLDLLFNVAGNLNKPLLTGKIDWLTPGYKDIQFKRLYGDLTGTLSTETINLSKLYLTSKSGATHEITGSIDLKDRAKGSLEFKIRDQDIHEILEPMGYEEYASGNFSADLLLSGYIEEPYVKFNLIKGPEKILGLDTDNLKMTVSYENGVILVTQGSGNIGGGSFSAFGHGDIDGNANLQFSLKKIPLSSILLPEEYKKYLFGGLGTINGRLSGTLKKPIINGEAVVEDAIILNERLDRIGILFAFADNNLSIINSEIKWGQGLFVAKGELDFANKKIASEITALRADIPKIAALAGYSLPENIWANFDAKVTGTLDDPIVSLNISRALWSLPGIQPTLTAKVKYENGIMQINDASLYEGNSYIQLAGSFSQDGNIYGTLQGDSIDLKTIKNAFDLKQEINGKVAFKANVSGTLENFKGLLELQASDVYYEKLQLQGLLGSFAIDPQGIRINEFRASIEGNELIALGTLPWPKDIEAFSQIPLPTNSQDLPLKVSIRSPRSNLTAFNGLINGLAFDKGQLKIDLDVAGNWQRPNFAGYITLTDTSLHYDAYSEPIVDLNGDVVFSGNKAEIRDISAKVGKGSLKLGGLVYLDSVNPSVSISYDIRKLPYHTDLVKTVITGQGRLSGTLKEPRLDGIIELENTDVNLAAYKNNSPQSAAKLPLILDLSVVHKGEFRVRGMGLDAKGTGNVQLTGTLSDLRLDGRIEGTEGRINYLDNIFEITRAQLIFQRYRGVVPVISAEALTRLPDADIRVQVNGSLGDLRTTLLSDPPMDETDILRKLTLHRFSSFAGGDIQQALTEELLRIVGSQIEATVLGDVEDAMRETFKLDEFRLEPNVMERTVKFKAGKYLLDNLYFTYSRTLEVKAKEMMKLEYRLRPQTKLTASLDDTGEFRLGVEFGISF